MNKENNNNQKNRLLFDDDELIAKMYLKDGKILNYKNISATEIIFKYKDNWVLQYKFPTVDLWLDYDAHKDSLISFLALCQMNVEWRYRC